MEANESNAGEIEKSVSSDVESNESPEEEKGDGHEFEDLRELLQPTQKEFGIGVMFEEKD